MSEQYVSYAGLARYICGSYSELAEKGFVQEAIEPQYRDLP